MLNIEFQHLPAYSLNLNPIQLLWKVSSDHMRKIDFSSKKLSPLPSKFLCVVIRKL
ncbi:hypothetical protein VCR4J2_250748 [Vibrio coralliirubri]|nr:hypothetical protein VCR4J2_250748 [Vibrio coralliirubri]